MLKDQQYLGAKFELSERKHHYGSHVHLLSDPYLTSLLCRLGSPDCRQPEVLSVLRRLYDLLGATVTNHALLTTRIQAVSRMQRYHPKEGVYEIDTIARDQSTVTVSVARGGTVPSQTLFEVLNGVLNPEFVRQDHMNINRKTDSQQRVCGAETFGTKIGGPVDDRLVFIPDPMGATGATIAKVIEFYESLGKPKKFIAVHLIVTPEYLAAMNPYQDRLEIYAIRLDRGLSADPSVFASEPGKYADKERGLNGNQYIVPGAGGLGEVFNNAEV